jgi:mono/diheme cytochrome c family protein
LKALALLAVLGLVVFWFATIARPLQAEQLPKHVADIANGAIIYNVGGCHSCHLPPAGLAGVDAALPAGGKALKTPIGTLYPPNLTPDAATGLGQWSDVEFVNAMQLGIGRSGQHLIPAFPYTSYAHMKVEDVLDLKAYLASLPAVNNPSRAPDVIGLPFIRRGLGLWKYVGLDLAPTSTDDAQTAGWNRGRYLVDGPGHCAECHTPRNIFMALDSSSYLAGGPHPEGKGKVPSLLDLISRKRFKDVDDLKSALQFGEAMGYQDMAAGGMGAVQTNLSKLPEEDIRAIAEYLASLPSLK